MIREYFNIFWSSWRLKLQFFVPFILLLIIAAILFFFPIADIITLADIVAFIPMFLIMFCLCTLVCYFSINNYLKAKHGNPAFEGDFTAFNEADIEKQKNAGHWRIIALPVTTKQGLTLGFLLLTLFMISSIFIN